MKMLRFLMIGLTVSSCGVHRPGTSSEVRSISSSSPLDFDFQSDRETYQIGTEFGKKPVTEATFTSESKVFERAARATARTSNGGTAFYLGKFNGEHVMATNHHVFEDDSSCSHSTITMPLLAKNAQGRFECSHLIGSWDSIDFALFTIKVTNPDDDAQLAAVGRNVEFNSDLKRGELLLTIGFGVAENPRRTMMANQDSDCKVFSDDAEYRLLGDPDDLNPAPYKAWSFINGCDVSHGDSGSAMVDRTTGAVVGIIWTGKIPKKSEVRQPGYTDRILSTNSPEIWSELSMAVPARKIGEHLRMLTSDRNTSQRDRNILTAVVAQ